MAFPEPNKLQEMISKRISDYNRRKEEELYNEDKIAGTYGATEETLDELGLSNSEANSPLLNVIPEYEEDVAPDVIPKVPPKSNIQLDRDPFVKPQVNMPELSKLSEILKKQPSKPSQRSLLDRYDKDLDQALADKQKNDRIAMMMLAGNQLVGALTGTKADQSGVKALQKMGESKLKGYQAKRQKFIEDIDIKSKLDAIQDIDNKKDASSPISQMYRLQYKNLTGRPIGDEVSAHQLEKAGLNLGKLVGLEQNKLNQQKAQAAKNAKSLADKEARAEAKREKMGFQERKILLDLDKRVDGLMRGGKMKKLWERELAINDMNHKLSAAISGKSPITKEAAVDLSTSWSSALSGGVPPQALIFETMPTSVKGKFGSAVNFVTGKPTAGYYTPEMLKYMKQQLDILNESTRRNLGLSVSRALMPVSNLYNKYPDEKALMQEKYKDYITFDEKGLPRAKYDTDSGSQLQKDAKVQKYADQYFKGDYQKAQAYLEFRKNKR